MLQTQFQNLPVAHTPVLPLSFSFPPEHARKDERAILRTRPRFLCMAKQRLEAETANRLSQFAHGGLQRKTHNTLLSPPPPPFQELADRGISKRDFCKDTVSKRNAFCFLFLFAVVPRLFLDTDKRESQSWVLCEALLGDVQNSTTAARNTCEMQTRKSFQEEKTAAFESQASE